jgi:ADP-heptose:LPS heptosyltransferase
MKTPARRILVIVTRRIGDVLLTTPLIRSIKQAWPETQIDALVFENTQGVLSCNPDLHRVITVPERPRLVQHLKLLWRLLRRYDIALSTHTGDRPTMYAWIAGKWRAGLLNPRKKERWKTYLLSRWVEFDNLNTHTVLMNLKLADLLNIPRSAETVVAWDPHDEQRTLALLPFDPINQAFAVLHVYPKFNYKMWHPQGWIDVAQWLDNQGLRIVLSGSGDTKEQNFVATLASAMPAGSVNLAGKLSIPQVGSLLNRARLYLGPDTLVTHMAAALGTPTVALYGPSNPVKWGPWPRGHSLESNPWGRLGSQKLGNVQLVQGPGACVPCLLEGCDRHVASFSDCLQQLSSVKVIAAAQELLGKYPAVLRDSPPAASSAASAPPCPPLSSTRLTGVGMRER